VDFNAEGTEFAENDGVPHPPVFFVRVANTGLKLDAASRASTKEARLRVEGSELNGEGFGELNTETQSTQRLETGTGLEMEAGMAASMGNGSMDCDYCQGNSTIIYHSNVRRGSGVDGRSWREFCGLVRRFGWPRVSKVKV
jgi:hypothetical protein